jgi:hypothetical protein
MATELKTFTKEVNGIPLYFRSQADMDAFLQSLPSAPTGTVNQCKFDTGCKNPKCHFFHPSTGGGSPALATASASTTPATGTGKQCKFGAGCKNTKCYFNHPSPAAAQPKTVPTVATATQQKTPAPKQKSKQANPAAQLAALQKQMSQLTALLAKK